MDLLPRSRTLTILRMEIAREGRIYQKSLCYCPSCVDLPRRDGAWQVKQRQTRHMSTRSYLRCMRCNG